MGGVLERYATEGFEKETKIAQLSKEKDDLVTEVKKCKNYIETLEIEIDNYENENKNKKKGGKK
jgi:predicted ribosome quality control (RQC) complex YloA/Tae2 family protein